MLWLRRWNVKELWLPKGLSQYPLAVKLYGLLEKSKVNQENYLQYLQEKLHPLAKKHPLPDLESLLDNLLPRGWDPLLNPNLDDLLENLWDHGAWKRPHLLLLEYLKGSLSLSDLKEFLNLEKGQLLSQKEKQTMLERLSLQEFLELSMIHLSRTPQKV
jgi:hypothetical protein